MAPGAPAGSLFVGELREYLARWDRSGKSAREKMLVEFVRNTRNMTGPELEREFGAAIRDIVMDVTDDKGLAKSERKQRQIEHAAHISDKAKLVKLADKISNLRDMAVCPPSGWPLERRQDLAK